MTKRVLAIKGFVEELQQLALNGTPLRMAINGLNATMTAAQARKLLEKSEQTLQRHLVNIVEKNDEQADALLADLKISS